MGFYSLNMLAIALELARENPVYEAIATKFFVFSPITVANLKRPSGY